MTDPAPEPESWWLVEETPARIVYRSDSGVIRYEWKSPAHRAIRVAVGDLRLIAESSGPLTLTQLSNSVRVLARVAIAFIRVHLAQDNPETDPNPDAPPTPPPDP